MGVAREIGSWKLHFGENNGGSEGGKVDSRQRKEGRENENIVYTHKVKPGESCKFGVWIST